MERGTRQLWASQGRHVDDRRRLFAAVDEAVDARTVLYPGSYIDIAPSFVFPHVRYVDVDRRAARFFADLPGVRELVAEHQDVAVPSEIGFEHADYRDPIELGEESFDLLVSLYAGFVSEHCTRYLRVGGVLLVNSSHGDAAMASIDDRYELASVVHHRSGRYRVADDDLDTYLVPERAGDVTVERLHELGRGIAYTRRAFAYLFRRVR